MGAGEQRVAEIVAGRQERAKRDGDKPGKQAHKRGAWKQATARLPNVQVVLNFRARLRCRFSGACDGRGRGLICCGLICWHGNVFQRHDSDLLCL